MGKGLLVGLLALGWLCQVGCSSALVEGVRGCAQGAIAQGSGGDGGSTG